MLGTDTRAPIRNVAATGRAVGLLFAEALRGLGLDAPPMDITGMVRNRGDEKFTLVAIPEASLAMAMRASARPEVVDAGWVQIRFDRSEIRLLLATCAGTERVDLAIVFRYVVESGGIATSEPGFALYNSTDADLEAFWKSAMAGVRSHKRIDEIGLGFGVLGPYQPAKDA